MKLQTLVNILYDLMKDGHSDSNVKIQSLGKFISIEIKIESDVFEIDCNLSKKTVTIKGI